MNLVAQLPILPVLLPVVLAPIASILPKGRTPWAFATIVAWVVLALSISLLVEVTRNGTIDYALGGWASPIGIAYRIDLMNAQIMVLVAAMVGVIMPFARHSVAAELPSALSSGFYALMLISFAGLMGMAATGDAFNVFVFMEISSLSTYALVAMGAGRDRRALTAAFRYVVLGTIGATFFVIGLGLLYQVTGTLNMQDLHVRLTGADNKVTRAAFGFIVTGLGLKLAMFPLHRWLPDAYTFAPSVVSAFLASTATKVAIYLMLRFLFTVFGFSVPFVDIAFTVFIMLGLVGMMSASLAAIFRTNVKQILAYSSVAQIGYMLLGISLATVEGLTAASVHLVAHAVMKAALFMAVGVVVYAVGGHRLTDFRGLGQRLPFTAACFTIGGLSLVGVPFTAGFVSKFLLIEATLAAVLPVPSLLIVALIVLSSLLAVVYVGRIVFEMYLSLPPPGAVTPRVPLSMLAPLGLMAFANLWIGFDAEGLTNLATGAAQSLMQSGLGMGTVQ